MNAIEQMIADALTGMMGNNLILLGFILIFVVLAIGLFWGLSFEGMIVFMIPALLLIFTAIPQFSVLKILVGLAAGLLVAYMFNSIAQNR